MGKLTCQDLMVGDLVYIHEPKCKGHRVDYINELDGQVGADGEVYDECDIRPIPLTEDILVKNGFSEIHHPGTGATDEYSEWFLGGIKITEWLEDWKDHHFSTGGDDCSISFNYVHELQHLLRLASVQKEIEL